MINLIDEKKIYNLSFIKTYSNFLIFTKNLLRILSKKGAIKHDSKYVFPLRWSIKKEKFVIDFRTLKNRDIEGIDLENVGLFFEEQENFNLFIKTILNSCTKELEDYLEKFRFKKNESKFLAISFDKVSLDYDKANFNILGVYKFTEYKNRPGALTSTKNRSILIDNHLDCLSKISGMFSGNCNVPRNYKINSYLEVYSKSKILLDKIYNQEKNYKKVSVLLYNELCNFILDNLKVKHDLICYDESIMKNIIIKTCLNLKSNNDIIEKEEQIYKNLIIRAF